MRPRHVLFLCVANSARSQMAAAIARMLAAPGVKVSSAGTRPSTLHPLAIEVLADVGIDIRGNPTRRLEDIPPDDVDVVITLCEEDVGARFPGAARRIHWALPDPALAAGTEADRLETFRRIRDELMRRLVLVFGGPRGIIPRVA
jgi:arsenate reductase